MPVPAPPARDLDEVERAREQTELDAPRLDAMIYDAVETLIETGALPRERWRFLAHVLFCRAIYETHIRPLEDRLTFEQIANHLKEIGVPRFRGASDWSAPAITDIRQVVSSTSNQIMLPDP
jgi:hypothetical protein